MPKHPFKFTKQVRKCNECGKEAYVRYDSCRKWDKELKKSVYCGFMRVLK